MATMTVAVGLIGTLDRGVVMRRREWLSRRERIADMPRHRAAGAVVAAFLDPAAELLDRGDRRVEDDRGRLRDRVRLDREHARLRAELALDDRLLRGVVEPADMQDRARGLALVGVRAHQRVRAKRRTAPSSSSVFVWASATQWRTCSSRILNASESSAVFTAEIWVRMSMQ